MIRKFQVPIAVILTALVMSAIALAQGFPTPIQGTDPSGNTQNVAVDTSGKLRLAGSGQGDTHGACVHTQMTIGTAATVCPPTPSAGRSSILIQLVQSGQNLRIVEDGTNTASTSVPTGIQVSSGNAFTDNLAGTVSTSCACDAASCAVSIDECP